MVEMKDWENESQKLSRRSFLKGATVLTAGMAVTGLVGCSKSETPGSSAKWMPEKWDHEADLVIVGAGAAGFAAAIDGTDKGLKVILLEAQPAVGGSSLVCNGGISMPGTPLQKEQGIEDTPQKFYDDLIKFTAPDNVPELIKVHTENAAHLWDWITGMGVEFKKEGLLATQGQSAAREHHIRPADVFAAFEKVAKEKSIEILKSTRATELIQNPETKRIIGLKAESDGTVLYFKAKRAVLLSSGGYARNADMLKNYNVPGVEKSIVFSGMGDNGDGIRMAQLVGANTRKLPYLSLLTGQHPSGDPTKSCSMMNQGAAMVNKQGLRFCDESLGYGNVWPYVASQTDAICYQIWDQKLATAMADNASSLYSQKKIEATGVMFKADTLADLAAQMKIPADAFVTTMNKYNNDIKSVGYDTAFGRKFRVSGAGAVEPLAEPPFYGFESTNVLYATYGGLKENEGSQVLDVNDNPIPGLYCAGGIAQYAMFGVSGVRGGKGASGCGFGGAMIHGRLVAEYATKLTAWDEEA